MLTGTSGGTLYSQLPSSSANFHLVLHDLATHMTAYTGGGGGQYLLALAAAVPPSGCRACGFKVSHPPPPPRLLSCSPTGCVAYSKWVQLMTKLI
jgi:hypothetical protein